MTDALTGCETIEHGSRIFSYGGKPRETGLVREQLWLGHLYRAGLTEIECARRQRYRALRSSVSATLRRYEKAHRRLNVILKNLQDTLPKKDQRSPAQTAYIRAVIAALARILTLMRRERRVVEAEYFRPGNTEWQTRRQARIAALTKSSPNAGERINRELLEEMALEGWPPVWIAKQRSEAASVTAVKLLRSQSLAFPGTRAAVDKACDISFKTCKKRDPRTPPFDFYGRVGIQIAGKLTVGELFSGQDPRVSLKLEPDVHIRKDKRNRPGPRPYRTKAHAKVKLAGRGSKGTFLNVDFVMHRPLPLDARVSWVFLMAKRVGHRSVYELQFTLKASFTRLSGSGVLALNHGWRMVTGKKARDGVVNGKRGDVLVATTWDGTKNETLVLPKEMIEDIKFARILLGHADEHFDDARAEASLHLPHIERELAAREERLGRPGPDLSSLWQWRAHRKLWQVTGAVTHGYAEELRETWNAWRDERLGGHHDLFAPCSVILKWAEDRGMTSEEGFTFYLYAWRRKDRHLTNWARDIQKRLQRRRKDIYRKLAHNWSQKYHTMVVEEWDKSETARRPGPEDDPWTKGQKLANAIRQFCGVSVLTEALAHAFGKERFIRVKAHRITTQHIICAGSSQDPMPTRMVKCTKCKKKYNQDLNAAQHLWHRYCEEGDDEALAAE